MFYPVSSVNRGNLTKIFFSFSLSAASKSSLLQRAEGNEVTIMVKVFLVAVSGCSSSGKTVWFCLIQSYRLLTLFPTN